MRHLLDPLQARAIGAVLITAFLARCPVRVCSLLTVGLLLSSTTARAGDDLTPTQIERLSTEPGVQMNRRTEGDTSITSWIKNGVTIERRATGSNVVVTGNDNSGKGAVTCVWGIYVGARAALDVCPSDHDGPLKADLDHEIEQIDKFIIANAIETISYGELRARELKNYASELEKAQALPNETAKVCTSGGGAMMIAYFNRMTHEQRQKMVDDTLSIPRWPVLNPCL